MIQKITDPVEFEAFLTGLSDDIRTAGKEKSFAPVLLIFLSGKGDKEWFLSIGVLMTHPMFEERLEILYHSYYPIREK